MAKTTTYKSKTTPLWRNISFHLLWSSTFASGLGDRMAMLAALGVLGYAGKKVVETSLGSAPVGEVDDSTILSGIQFFFFLPYLMWSPIAGWLADRLPRKWLMFTADELRGVIIIAAFALAPMYLQGGQIASEHRWVVWTMILLVGVMAATFSPVKLSIVPNVVGLASLQRANAIVLCMGIIGNLLGFFIGGPMVERASIQTVLLVAALCYGVSGCFWIFLKTPFQMDSVHAKLKSVGQAFVEIRQGVDYALRHRPVWVLIAIAAIVWACTSVYQPALGVVNSAIYGGNKESFAYLMGCLGIGMLVGSVLMGLINTRVGSEIFITVGLTMVGLFIAIQMVLPWQWVGMTIAFCTGVVASMLIVPLNTMIQRITPDRIRGRVFAAKEIVGELGNVFFAWIIWQVPNTDPIMRPLAIGMAAMLIAAAAVGLFIYVLRGSGTTRMINFLIRFVRLYSEAVHRLKITGRHNVPHKGPVLLVANHTAGIDPFLIQSALPRVVVWLMAKEYRLWVMGWFWRQIKPILVDRQSGDSTAAKAAIRTLRSGGIVGIFPQGGINRDQQTLGEISEGVGLIALKGNPTIVPIHISGTPEAGTLTSCIMPSHSKVYFGKPFTLDKANNNRREATELIRKKMIECRMADDSDEQLAYA